MLPSSSTRAIAPDIAPCLDGLGLADADDLALMEHLQARGVPGGLVAKDVGATGIDSDAAGRKRAASGDRRIDRVAGCRREDEIGHVLELAPVLMQAGALVLLGGIGLRSLEREDAAGEMWKGFQVADRLQVMARHDRGETQLLGLFVGARAGDEGGDPLAHVLEVPAATVDAGHAGLDQQATADELGEQRRLIGAGRANARH